MMPKRSNGIILLINIPYLENLPLCDKQMNVRLVTVALSVELSILIAHAHHD